MTHSAGQIEGTVPGGEVRTFLIADVRGYTHFTLEHGDVEAARLAARFAEVAGGVVSAGGGEVIELRGDEALAVFTSTRAALRAATELQARLVRETEADPSLPLKVGIGLDAGEAIPVAGGFRGAALNLAGRLCSLAGPGEILASETVTALARKMEGLEYLDRGTAQLKGFADLVKVIEVKRSAISYQLSASEPGGSLSSPESDSMANPDGSGLREQGLGVRSLPIGGFLGSLPSTALVGREAELARAGEIVEAALAGGGRLVLLAGEPGAGKTRLAQEVTLVLRDGGFMIAAGRCYEPQLSVPFYPFLDVLTTLYDAAPPAVRAKVPRAWPDLARMLPALGLPVADFAGPQDQQRLFWTVTGFLQAIAAVQPTAVLLDDLHWSDSASLELLQHLARHTGTDRIFLLGLYRDVEVGRRHPLEGALRDLQREDLVERIDIRRLGPIETAALMAVTVGEEEEISEEFSSLVFRRTEGNPFFIQQVMRALVARGDIFRRDGHWDRRAIEEIQVPESVRSVVGQRLSRLLETTQEILREASVLGQTFSFDDLQSMSDRQEQELESALDSSITAGLVRDMGRDVYAFDHALTQGSLYGELSSRRRRRLHLSAAEAIEGLSETKRATRAAELAWHFLEADEPTRAIHWSLIAGDESRAVFAHHDAEYHYRIALGLAHELGDRDQESQAAESLGRTMYSLARNDESLTVLEEAAAIYHAKGDVDAEARVVAAIGSAYFQMSRLSEGVNRLQPLLESRESDMEPAASAAVLVELGNLYWGMGQYQEAAQLSERAAKRAQDAGDERALARAEFRWGTALTSLDRSGEGLPHLDSAIVLAEQAGDLITLARSLNNRAICHERAHRWEEAWADLQGQLELARRAGNPDQLVYALGNLAMNAFWLQGDWARAEPYADEVLRIGRRLRRTRATFHVAMGLFMRRIMGDEKATAELEDLAEDGERIGDGAMWAWAQIFLGTLDLHERPAEARRRLEPLLDHPAIEEGRRRVASSLARACLLTADLERAEALLVEYHPTLDREREELGEWMQTDGMLRARRGRWQEARAGFEAALAIADGESAPFLRAATLLELGVTHALMGEPSEAAERFEAALEAYRHLGAVFFVEYAEKVRTEMIETGESSSGTTGSPRPGLNRP